MTAQDYLKQIEKALAVGNATEHTHRPALKSFIESLADHVTATNEPKRIKCGAPDYIVTRGQTPLGYIEAKDVGESLDRVERSEQMARYRESLGNLILTDYLEFRWYVRGQHRLTARLAKPRAKGKLKPEADGAATVTALLTAFFDAEIPLVASAKELAPRMAAIAQLIGDTIRRAFNDEDKGGSLHHELEGFRKVLLHDLTEDQFADMYAQTICYGLFAARCNTTGSDRFTREHAAFRLPKTNPFLRKLFGRIAGPEIEDQVVWAVDDLAELLNQTDISAILQDFGKRTRREDPVVHFYETFLAAYDPRMREARGVYYTPEPVVSYIVRSVDHLLKHDFGLPDGLADASKIHIKPPASKSAVEVHKVLILDPATGTGTFLYEVINQIHEAFRNNRGMWSSYVSEHLLPRVFGFELLMAPYAVAHMKLGLQLDALGYDFRADERLRLYLTNTLEEAHEDSRLPLFAQWLAEEANAASRVKQEAPVMVVLGNPPYSYESVNIGAWISNLVRRYYEVDGQPLGERNPKGLQDDYVKFFRFAQWRIEQTGYGILAFISNHGYLDNPTFRGMRQSLMETFDDIYVLDLHGNSKKKERSPDGTEDKNVFDIQQGVAIGLFIKRGGAKKKAATVHHAHLWGVREVYEKDAQGEQVLSGGKDHWLWQNDVSTTEWNELRPQSSFYLFTPQQTALMPEYQEGFKITEIMPINSVGIVTSRDNLAVHFSPEEAKVVIGRFVSMPPETAKEAFGLAEDSRDWKIDLAQKDLRAIDLQDNHLLKMSYRPFDVRFTYYTGRSRGFHSMPRPAVMKNMLKENMALLTSRMTKGEQFAHVHLTKHLSEKILLSPKTSNNSFHFPLYLYLDEVKTTLFDNHDLSDARGSRRPNLAPSFVGYFAEKLKMDFIEDGKGDRAQTFGPEDVFDYMYAVFHSPTYRRRYGEFLKIDFPRLPLTANADLFRALCALGAELVALHLMEKPARPIPGYPIPGDNTVEAVRYTEPEPGASGGRVWINKTQYVDGVPTAVWAFHVGGYQVCQKWLKDRKGRKLTYDDWTHYQRVVAALSETIRLMADIDAAIETHGGWPLQ